MGRRYTSLEKVLMVLTAFTIGFFVETHVLLWHLSASDTLPALGRLLAVGAIPVVAFTLAVWVALRLTFVE
jgi:hypothetical protein